MYTNNLRLKYNFPSLPAIADRNGEAVVNWTQNGNHSITVDNAYVHSGSNSFKITASAAGDLATNHVSLPSAYCPAWVVGKNYCITLWAFIGAAIPYLLSMEAGGASAGSQVIDDNPSDGMQGYSFLFTAASATAPIVLWLNEATSVWIDDITVSEFVDLNALIAKGIDDPDMFELFPPIFNEYIDGSLDTQFTAFRKKMSFYCGVVSAQSDRIGVLYWFKDNARQIDYGDLFQVSVVPNWHNSDQTAGEFSNNWINDFIGGREFTLELLESVVRQTFPT